MRSPNRIVMCTAAALSGAIWGIFPAAGQEPNLRPTQSEATQPTPPNSQQTRPEKPLDQRSSNRSSVITPPPTGDSGVVNPPSPGPQSMPIIPPPGTQGGAQNVQPK